MTSRYFSWDETKNQTNKQKHRVSFEQAAHVFSDPLHVSFQDRVEEHEIRWQTIGSVGGVVLLLVAHAVFESLGDDGGEIEVIRIISARKATCKERMRYENS